MYVVFLVVRFLSKNCFTAVSKDQMNENRPGKVNNTLKSFKQKQTKRLSEKCSYKIVKIGSYDVDGALLWSPIV